MNETNKIEYKLEFTSDTDIEKEVIAFLNYKEGGFVYIGIDKDGDVVGVDNVDDCMLKIKDRLKNNISPSALGLFDISQEYCCGVKIIKITIASGLQKPYYKTKYGMTSKGCFIRVGTAAEPMSQTLIEKQFARRVRNSIGEITSSRQELTFAQLRIEEFFTGISIPRNRELMRVFRDLELVESLGSGIPRILKAYSRDCFVFMENFTRIILPMDKSYVKTTQKTAQKTAQKTTQKTDDKIVEIIKDNPCISRKQLSKLCGISQDGIKWQLKNLQKENKIRRVGPDKGGYWEVVD